ncbi:MAG TPA: head-tail adaptor protein [Segetibacter sp.]|jgi:head-tail adaptor
MSKAIGQMNRLVNIESLALTDDGHGGKTEGAESTKRTFWANKKEKNSNVVLDSGQVVNTKTYIYTARNRKSLVLKVGDTLIDGNSEHTITGFVLTDNDTFIEITTELKNG